MPNPKFNKVIVWGHKLYFSPISVFEIKDYEEIKSIIKEIKIFIKRTENIKNNFMDFLENDIKIKVNKEDIQLIFDKKSKCK
jgi:hypothetical protein